MQAFLIIQKKNKQVLLSKEKKIMECRQFINERIERLREKMRLKEIDTVILQKPENVFYFSNFNPVLNSHPAIMIISLEQEPCLLVHAIRCDHAREEGATDNVQLYGMWGSNPSLCLKPEDAVGLIIEKRQLRVGLELDCISVDFSCSIQKVLEPREIISISETVSMMKME